MGERFPVTLVLSHQWIPFGESFICLKLCHSVALAKENNHPLSTLVDGGS